MMNLGVNFLEAWEGGSKWEGARKWEGGSKRLNTNKAATYRIFTRGKRRREHSEKKMESENKEVGGGSRLIQTKRK